MGLLALWLTRLVLLGATVGVPVLFIASIIRGDSYDIAAFFMMAFFILMAIAGLVYSLMRWGDPPLWAVMAARATAYRDQWHKPEP
jgi:hypothetical protein